MKLLSFLTTAGTALLLPSCANINHGVAEIIEFTDCAVCPEMVLLPRAKFQMGDLSNTQRANERPVRETTVDRPIAVSKYPITIADFRHFVSDTGYITEAESSGGCWSIKSDKSVGWVPTHNWKNAGLNQGDNHPAVCLSLQDANAYTDWLSAQADALYRLPTEAEWEYAGRAGTTTKYVFGDNPENVCLAMNWSDDQTTHFWDGGEELLYCDDNFLFTSPVGSFPPNNFGLYDMYGNVWEWVLDCYQENLTSTVTNQISTSEIDCELQTLRGASWAASLQGTTSSYRISAEKTMRTADYGFRVLREVADLK